MTKTRKIAIFPLFMNVRKLISSFALTAMILASFVGVCKQMVMSCGIDCGIQTVSAAHAGMDMDECDGDGPACAHTTQDHMTTFASLYPSVTTDTTSVLLVISVAFALAWFSSTKEQLVDNDKLRIQLRYLKQRLSFFLAPDFLVFAFSNGILNSKRFA